MSVSQRITPKDLRATCGSWVAASDGVLEAAKRLGHSKAAAELKAKQEATAKAAAAKKRLPPAPRAS